MEAASPRFSGRAVGWLALAATTSWTCNAAMLEVAVVDERGEPLAETAVYATPPGGAPRAAADELVVSIDQKSRRFEPHVSVVQVGTAVRFPNSDDVSHHVYSFSPAKPFELPLYKGSAYPPVVFDTPGEVVLGCNIHDGMLAYILVVATPYFALTDERGIARIADLPSGEYSLAAWTPRARPAGLPAAQTVHVASDGPVTAKFRVSGRLAPEHAHHASGLTWERY